MNKKIYLIIMENINNEFFGEVANSMKEVVEGIDTVIDKANELDNSKAVVIDSISSLSSIAEENAASCQETNASMTELNSAVEDIRTVSADIEYKFGSLRDIISYFKL